MTTPPYKTGEVLLGKYRVEHVLGQGGMGVVIVARHIDLDEPVAIKFLLESALTDDGIRRFMREAKAAAKIRSEFAARVHDVGRMPTGAPYLVMEYLDGQDLRQMLKQRGPIQPQEACDIVLQVCEALALAHARGIVHRDIKPSNIFLCPRPDGALVAKVIDFGISKTATTSTSPQDDMTRSSSIVGSPRYMAPEQMRSSKSVDGRADVWSLGATLHKMVTGKAPFPGSNVLEIFEASLLGYSGVQRPAPPPVDSIIAGCLMPDLEQRVPSVAHLARLVGQHCSARWRHLVERVAANLGEGDVSGDRLQPSSSVSVSGMDLSLQPVGTESHPSTQQVWTGIESSTTPPKRRVPLIAIGAGGLAVLGVGFIGYMATRNTSPPSLAGASSGAPVVAASAGTGPSQTGIGESASAVATTETASLPSASASASAKTAASAKKPKPRPQTRPRPRPRPTPAAPVPPPPAPPRPGPKPGTGFDEPF